MGHRLLTIPLILVASVCLAQEENGPITNSIGMRLMPIPAGEFTMGIQPHLQDGLKGWMRSDAPEHRVRLSRSIYLAESEVTEAQWIKLMQFGQGAYKNREDYPATLISWKAAIQFCERLSSLPKERAAGRIYRLPTEAEWEHACRAGSTTGFYFGDDPKLPTEHGWFKENYKIPNVAPGTCRVKQKKPNAWGLFDMHGNVAEMCFDAFAHYPKSALDVVTTDPSGPASGLYPVARGGGWQDEALQCLSGSRKEGLATNTTGFRVAMLIGNAPLTKARVETLPLSDIDLTASIDSEPISPPPHRRPNPAPLRRAMAFSTDGKLLFVGDAEYSVQVFDAKSGNKRNTYNACSYRIRNMLSLPSNLLVCSGDIGSNINISDYETGCEVIRLKGQGGPIAISPNGKLLFAGNYLLSISSTSPLKIGAQVRTFVMPHRVREHMIPFFSPDNRFLVLTHKQRAWAWELATNQVTALDDIKFSSESIVAWKDVYNQLEADSASPLGMLGVIQNRAAPQHFPVYYITPTSTWEIQKKLQPMLIAQDGNEMWMPSCAASPNSKTIAALMKDGAISLFDASTMTKLIDFIAPAKDGR